MELSALFIRTMFCIDKRKRPSFSTRCSDTRATKSHALDSSRECTYVLERCALGKAYVEVAVVNNDMQSPFQKLKMWWLGEPALTLAI